MVKHKFSLKFKMFKGQFNVLGSYSLSCQELIKGTNTKKLKIKTIKNLSLNYRYTVREINCKYQKLK